MGKSGGDLRWGREKVACWRTKVAISLKRVKIEEKSLWTAYRNSPTLFRMVPSQTPYGLPFPKIGGLQLSYPLLSQEQVKLRTSNLADTFTGPIGIRALRGHLCDSTAFLLTQEHSFLTVLFLNFLLSYML